MGIPTLISTNTATSSVTDFVDFSSGIDKCIRRVYVRVYKY